MAKSNKTQKTAATVADFVNQLPDNDVKTETEQLLALFKKCTGQTPAMWGPAIIGFGEVHLRYASGRELDWFAVGFSPRKGKLSLYFTDGIDRHSDLLAKLGTHSIGKSCLYIKKITNINISVLEQIITASYQAQTA